MIKNLTTKTSYESAAPAQNLFMDIFVVYNSYSITTAIIGLPVWAVLSRGGDVWRWRRESSPHGPRQHNVPMPGVGLCQCHVLEQGCVVHKTNSYMCAY